MLAFLVNCPRFATAAHPCRRKSQPRTTESKKADRLTYRLIEEALDTCRSANWPVLALEVGAEGAHLEALQSMFRRRGVSLIVVPERSARPDLYYQIDGQ